MLAIDRTPFYKNKLLLSSLAVFAGFFVTVGIIRAVDPASNSTSQSSQTTSDRRASSLIPINASDEEKSSESGTSDEGNDAKAADSKDPATASGSTWIAPAPAGSSTPRQPAASGTSSPAPAPTSSSSTATQPSSTTSTSQPTPTSTQPAPADDKTCVDLLGKPILCL